MAKPTSPVANECRGSLSPEDCRCTFSPRATIVSEVSLLLVLLLCCAARLWQALLKEVLSRQHRAGRAESGGRGGAQCCRVCQLALFQNL